jgi:hypothetical protein
MNRFSTLALLPALLLAMPAFAAPGDHLEPLGNPADNPFGTSTVEAVVFKEAYGRDVRARAFMTSAMFPSSDMLAVKETHGVWRAVYLHVPAVVAVYSAGAMEDFGAPPRGQPAVYHKIRPARCEVPLAPALGPQLVAAWRGVLMNTHYDAEPRRGLDGGWVTFSMMDGHQELAGTIWSPDGRTEPAMLLGIVEDLRDVCVGDRARGAQLGHDVDMLLTELKTGPRK